MGHQERWYYDEVSWCSLHMYLVSFGLAPKRMHVLCLELNNCRKVSITLTEPL
jgi:hypothetical protein